MAEMTSFIIFCKEEVGVVTIKVLKLVVLL